MKTSWKLVTGAFVATIGLWLILPSSSCGTPSMGTTTPGPVAQDGGTAEAEPSVVVPAAVEVELPDAVEEEPKDAEEPEEVVPSVPQTVAEKFVAAGGQKLCLAMVTQLNPDWRMDACQSAQPGPNGEDRKAECENQRRPLIKFAEDVCKTVIEESLRLDLDPGMVLSIIERESSFGRASWDQQDRRYEVQTDICKLTLPKSRLVERVPGRRAGTELMTWTYGPQAPTAGSVARNRQPVIVVSENDEEIVLNTCSAGEAGIMQTVPREWRHGTVVGATGEELDGTASERRARIEADPILQVRLGCQALAEHRGLMPPEAQGDWVDWIHIYNTGDIRRSDHGREYAGKIVRHYMDACRGWFYEGEIADLSALRNVKDVWPECQRLETVLETLRGAED